MSCVEGSWEAVVFIDKEQEKELPNEAIKAASHAAILDACRFRYIGVLH